jgi:hypothetical protein
MVVGTSVFIQNEKCYFKVLEKIEKIAHVFIILRLTRALFKEKYDHVWPTHKMKIETCISLN